MRRVMCFLAGLVLAGSMGWAQEPPPGAENPPPLPPPRAVPGLTAPDAYPEACVSCHLDMPAMPLDARLSTAMKLWTEGADPNLVAKAQGTMPPEAMLTGKHPASLKALENIPAACIQCHSHMKKAPPFAPLIHVIHLTSGAENHFMTIFQGECTHCHKLDPQTGTWTVPSGPEASP